MSLHRYIYNKLVILYLWWWWLLKVYYSLIGSYNVDFPFCINIKVENWVKYRFNSPAYTQINRLLNQKSLTNCNLNLQLNSMFNCASKLNIIPLHAIVKLFYLSLTLSLTHSLTDDTFSWTYITIIFAAATCIFLLH